MALDPRRDFGATALDRPLVSLPVRVPRLAPAPRPWLERPGALGWLGALVFLACAVGGTLVGAVLAWVL